MVKENKKIENPTSEQMVLTAFADICNVLNDSKITENEAKKVEDNLLYALYNYKVIVGILNATTEKLTEFMSKEDVKKFLTESTEKIIENVTDDMRDTLMGTPNNSKLS